MTPGISVGLLVLCAVLAANLPFLNQRLLSLWPLPSGKVKPLGLRLVELVLLYFAVGILGRWLEQRAGQNAPQGWEFYAVSAALFLTFAFPGFVFRYLLRRGR